MGWQWHQLDYVQIICTSLQTDNNLVSQFASGQVLFLKPDQQRQSTEGNRIYWFINISSKDVEST